MSDSRRVPFTVRLNREDKESLDQFAESGGLESGIAARAILELFLRRVSKEESLFQTLADLERAMMDLHSKRQSESDAA